MANSSDMIAIQTTRLVCREILSFIQSSDCKTLADAENFVNEYLEDTNEIARKKDVPTKKKVGK